MVLLLPEEDSVLQTTVIMGKLCMLWSRNQKYLVRARGLSWLCLLALSLGEREPRESGPGASWLGLVPGWGESQSCPRGAARGERGWPEAPAAVGGDPGEAGPRSRALRPDRPLTRAAPLPPARQPAPRTAPAAPHPRLGLAGPPQPRAASALPCRGWRSITNNSHAARVPRRRTHPAALQSDSRLWGAATIHALLSPLKHPRRPSGCRYCPETQGDSRAWQSCCRCWGHPLAVSILSSVQGCLLFPCMGIVPLLAISWSHLFILAQ